MGFYPSKIWKILRKNRLFNGKDETFVWENSSKIENPREKWVLVLMGKAI